MSKTVFITGASSGIGRATALRCAEEGHRVLVCARRKESLDQLAEEIQTKTSSDVFSFTLDVSNYQQVEEKLQNLPFEWQEIDVLVNNAGLALGLSSVDQGDIQDWETMIDVNVKGLLYVTRVVAKGMLERNSGHIINIGSISGREVYAKGNVYCATKHAVRALSESMKRDWHGTPIRVSEVNPGIVETEFSKVRFKNDQQKAGQVYAHTTPLQAEDVADAIYYCLSRPQHVDIREIFITPTVQSSVEMIDRKD